MKKIRTPRVKLTKLNALRKHFSEAKQGLKQAELILMLNDMGKLSRVQDMLETIDALLGEVHGEKITLLGL